MAGKTTRKRRNRRDRLMRQQKGMCWVCGCPMRVDVDPRHDEYPTFEHVVPRAAGGADTEANLQLSHSICNEKRGRYHEWEGYEAA